MKNTSEALPRQVPAALPTSPKASTLTKAPPPEAQLALHVTHAISARTYVEAFGGATLAQLTQHNGQQPVMVEVQVAVSKAMLAYAPARRMSNDQIVMFAEAMMEEFPNESLADLRLFARHVGSASYERGETYGAIDVPMLRRWWQQYLLDKAEDLERHRKQQSKAYGIELGEAMAGHPRMVEAMKAGAEIGRAKAEAERTDRIAAMRKLEADMPGMDREAMRSAYASAKDTEAKAKILAEARRRGYQGEEQQAAQQAYDAAQARREAEHDARLELEHKQMLKAQIHLFEEMGVNTQPQ